MWKGIRVEHPPKRKNTFLDARGSQNQNRDGLERCPKGARAPRTTPSF